MQNARGSVRLKAGDSSQSSVHSLLLWNVAEQCGTPEPHSSESLCPTYLQYISFRQCGSASAHMHDDCLIGSSACLWSHPVRLRISPTGKRHTLALPVGGDEGLGARACCLAVQSDSALVYLTLAEDKFPFIELQNNCDVPLFFGQAATDTAGLAGTSSTSDVTMVMMMSELILCFTFLFMY